MKKLIILVILFHFFPSWGQKNSGFAIVDGIVRDQQEQAIVGASVYLENTSFGSITNDKGYFKLENIPAGTYNVVVTYIGYATKYLYNFKVNSQLNSQLNITLEEAATTLDEVVVQDFFSYRKAETPLSTHSLSRVEIANYPGGNNDVVRVAQTLPGVAPSVGGFRNDLIIRGGAPNEVVYFMDGIELTAINHFSTQGSSGGPAGMLNVSFIEEVNLSTSSFAAKFDNALSGVMEFQQKEALIRKPNLNIRVGASETALTLSTPIQSKNETNYTQGMFSIRRSYLQFLFELIGLPIRPDYWDYQYKVTHKINDRNTINLIGIGSIDDFRVEAPTSSDPDQLANAEQSPFIEQETNTLGLSWKHIHSSNKAIDLWSISHNYKNNLYSRYTDNVNKTGLIFSNQFKDQQLQIRFNQQRFYNRWNLNWGANVKDLDYQYANRFENPALVDQHSIAFKTLGVYFQTSTSFLDDSISVSFGLRSDSNTYFNSNSVLGTLSPRIAIGYKLSTDTKLNLASGIYHKLPSFTILGYKDATNGLVNQQESTYIKSSHLVLGLEHYFKSSLMFSLEGFYKGYENYPVSIVDNVSLANKGAGFEVLGNEAVRFDSQGKSYGVEFMAQQKWSNNFYGIFSYTYFHSKFNSGVGTSYLPSSWDSRHLLSFTGGVSLNKNWELSSRFRYAGATPYAALNQEATLNSYPLLILDYSTLDSSKLDPFNQFDIRIDKKWSTPKIAYNLYLEIQNLLKSKIPQVPQYGLARDTQGAIKQPLELIDANSQTNQLIPTIGFVIDL